MDFIWIVVILTVAVAFAFDVINGFHDAANSIATIVSTRVLRPRYAVLWAAFFNFVALFIFAPRVADTIAKIVDVKADDSGYVWVVLAGLIGAIVWDLLTWWWGLPTSSSHALIGGVAGAGVAHAGFNVLNWDKILLTIGFIPLAPLMGMAVALLLLIAVAWTFRKWRPASVDSLFRKGQFLSAALYSLGHGGNDAQKTMGIIVALLVAAGSMAPDTQLSLSNPETLWIMLGANGAMALGTAFGGWRIVRTMGMKITELKPYGGFCAETAGAFTLFVATHLGVPVSTTHTITGAIVGVGAARGASAVKWGLARRIVWSWILTIPAAALVAAGTYMLTTIFHAR
ncbi:MAG TPA: inorganic phosphate transporter [Gemmatimonadota bacterium]|jgi:PiT family inorganic phosphate transporter|nr:inorganic phosphate transporter [Gemmatimonadota bacterium]